MAREKPTAERKRAKRAETARRAHSKTPNADTFGALRNGTFVGEAIYAGLAPEDILVYVERGEGRRNRPPSKASTVAPIVTAFGKAT